MIDPIRLKKIQHSSTIRTIKKFGNLNLDFDDVHSESMIGVMLSIKKFNKDRGYPLYSYIYANTMNHLRDYVNRKIIPQMGLNKERERLAIDVIHSSNHTPSFEGMVEAKDQVDKLRGEQDEIGKSIIQYLSEGKSHREIAKIVGMSSQGIDKRVKKMRVYLTESAQ